MSLQGPDPRERPGGQRDGGERPSTAPSALRRWGLPAAALVLIVAFGATVWLAYRPNDPAAPGFEPPLVRADARPTKSRPEDPGGWKAPHQDKLVFETLVPGPPAPGAERLLPGPEEPLPKPAPPAAVEPPPSPPQQTAIVVEETQAVPLPGQGGAAVPPPPAPGPLMLTPPPTAEPPAAQAPSPAPSPSAQPAAAPPPAAEPGGSYRLQLAAFQDRGQADTVWRRLQRAHPAVLAGLEPQVVAADLGAKGVWYRLQAASFGSEAAARAACELLKSHKQDCLVVKPG